ncbi:heterokaryon incompatibility protein-domain-containing protein [Stachybotrys elegans]|uniref:Heterokaryon incompatibility protein-domain-containing protein n=1 Tax=Stachybotrys elegans TaxID=80388 RepID=A0A8K0WJZ0_9HYPO|nr:heterokaryon incompatibility protein-domain-containing protein [Stachybotrys elegans]
MDDVRYFQEAQEKFHWAPSGFEKTQFCTSRGNVKTRTRGFDMNQLPQTFQDAITITRELQKRYLWIDSLCIVQDDAADWEQESQLMETVFKNAYCTIAASSAQDSTEGFLEKLPPYREHTSSHGPVYVCAAVDDFTSDVENSALNKRAWVLQERALSRRTIHFTASQIYWECGDGVRCETLTHMRNSKALFLGDPKFPKALASRPDTVKIELFQSLFTRYSQLGLTYPTDRPIAISALQKQLADTFKTEGKHGVFESLLHRSLLWQRSGPTRLERIFDKTDRRVPSWSWMAYNGGIEYMEIKSDQVEWNEGVKLVGDKLSAQVRTLRTTRTYHASKWLTYDEGDSMNVRRLRCVITGRTRSGFTGEQRYYVLVTVPRRLEGLRIFERVGVGAVPERSISFESGEDAWIL